MDISSSELKDRALSNLKGNWGGIVGAMFVAGIITSAVQMVPGFGGLAALVIGGPIALGIMTYALKFSRNEEPEFNTVFSGFQNFGNSAGAQILMTLIILGFFLLLIIPGIIRAIAYSQTFFIMAENPEMSPLDAMKKSREIMDGHKMDFFLLQLSFIGWILLCIPTLFIGALWLMPYIRVTNAHFYRELVGDEGAKFGYGGNEDLLDA